MGTTFLPILLQKYLSNPASNSLSMSNFRITNVGAAVNGTDAVNLNQVLSVLPSGSSGTLPFSLIRTGPPSTALGLFTNPSGDDVQFSAPSATGKLIFNDIHGVDFVNSPITQSTSSGTGVNIASTGTNDVVIISKSTNAGSGNLLQLNNPNNFTSGSSALSINNGTNSAAIDIANIGTGGSININQTGAGHAIQINKSSGTGSTPLLDINNTGTSNIRLCEITNTNSSSTNDNMFLESNNATTGHLIRLNKTAGTDPAIFLTNTSTSTAMRINSTGTNLVLDQQGSNDNLILQGVVNSGQTIIATNSSNNPSVGFTFTKSGTGAGDCMRVIHQNSSGAGAANTLTVQRSSTSQSGNVVSIQKFSTATGSGECVNITNSGGTGQALNILNTGASVGDGLRVLSANNIRFRIDNEGRVGIGNIPDISLAPYNFLMNYTSGLNDSIFTQNISETEFYNGNGTNRSRYLNTPTAVTIEGGQYVAIQPTSIGTFSNNGTVLRLYENSTKNGVAFSGIGYNDNQYRTSFTDQMNSVDSTMNVYSRTTTRSVRIGTQTSTDNPPDAVLEINRTTASHGNNIAINVAGTLSTTGITMSCNLGRIVNVGAPIDSQDAATKLYVDAPKVGAWSSGFYAMSWTNASREMFASHDDGTYVLPRDDLIGLPTFNNFTTNYCSIVSVANIFGFGYPGYVWQIIRSGTYKVSIECRHLDGATNFTACCYTNRSVGINFHPIAHMPTESSGTKRFVHLEKVVSFVPGDQFNFIFNLTVATARPVTFQSYCNISVRVEYLGALL